jgi:menaquinol-cytochrome c reductase cytochrome b subunit
VTIRRWLTGLATVTAVLFAVLIVTGIVLIFQYEPSGKFLGSDARPIAGAVGRIDTIRTIHRAASFAIVPVVFAAVVLAIIASTRRLAIGLLAGAATIVALAAAISGQAIAWSQLALFTVTTGHTYRGYSPIFGTQVRFVIVGDARVEVETFRRIFVTHALLLPVVLLALVGAIAFVVRRRRAADNLPSRT